MNNKQIMAVNCATYVIADHEEQKYRQIIAITATFDSVSPLMAAIILLQRFYKLKCKMPKTMLTHEIRRKRTLLLEIHAIQSRW